MALTATIVYPSLLKDNAIIRIDITDVNIGSTVAQVNTTYEDFSSTTDLRDVCELSRELVLEPHVRISVRANERELPRALLIMNDLGTNRSTSKNMFFSGDEGFKILMNWW